VITIEILKLQYITQRPAALSREKNVTQKVFDLLPPKFSDFITGKTIKYPV